MKLRNRRAVNVGALTPWTGVMDHARNHRREVRYLAAAAYYRMERLEARILLSAGDLDLTFGSGGTLLTDVTGHGEVDGGSAALTYADGRFLVAGWTQSGRDGTHLVLARYNADGSLDSTFGASGLRIYDQPSLPGGGPI